MRAHPWRELSCLPPIPLFLLSTLSTLTMRAALLAFALLPSVAFAAITINSPSASAYWVQNVSNLISWTYTQGDRSSVDIIVTNSDNATLNGAFSIARAVPVSQESFTVTDVTLRVGTGYQVVFVDPTNQTQVLAQSSDFEVKAAGTTPAPTTTPSSSVQASGSGTVTGSATSSGASATSSTRNSALGLAVDASHLFYASAIVAFGSFFL